MKAKTFLLIHGAWHSSTCWYKLIPLLQAQGHRVIAPDLPGHGANNVNTSKISLKTYTNFIVQLIKDEKQLSIIGHSMAGMIISQLGNICPDKVSSLIYLAAFIPQGRQSIFDLMEHNNTIAGIGDIQNSLTFSENKRICTVPQNHIKRLFYGQCSPCEGQKAVSEFSPQVTLPLAGKSAVLGKSFTQLNKIYICCSKDKVIPIEHQREMLKHQPCNQLLQLNSDHSPFLSMPETLANMLMSV